MAALLTGAAEVTTEHPVQREPIVLRIHITNDSDQVVEIVNPEFGAPPPGLEWKASYKAYQFGVLISIGLLKITLKCADGQLVESKGLVPWVTPILGKRALQPHGSLVLDFDLSELFSLDLAGVHNMKLRYGDDAVHADASTDIEIGPRDIPEQ